MSAAPQPRPGLVVAFLALALAPHLLRLPPWVSGLCLGAWAYALLAPRLGWRMPARGLLQILTVLAVISAGLQQALGESEGRALAGGIAVLASVMGLKPLESVSRRDHFAAVTLGLFLVLSSLFYSESLGMAGYLLGVALAACVVFMHLTRPQASLRGLLHQAVRLLLQGAPVMLVLFILFPRLTSGMFGMPSTAAPTGFDDNMPLGAVSQLVKDETLVFRADFETSPPPAAHQLYWRGLTLWEFDGKAWLRGPEIGRVQTALQGSQPVKYTVILEPMNTNWLFALDKPVHAPGVYPYWGTLYEDRTLRATRPVTQRRRYAMVSYLTSHDPASGASRKAGLQLPAAGNPKALALGRQLAQEFSSPQARAEAMLQRFRNEPFVYTLAPTALGQDPIDEFLFSTRMGFCEHYAAAFAFVMRAAGVPARVTLGYLGGVVNPLGGQVEVRQAEAHAWTEVVLPDRGWVRVDPTSAVAPERVMVGLEAALSAEDLQRHYHRNSSLLARWPWLRNALAALSYKWYDVVLSYGSMRQFQFLRSLGLDLRTLKGWLGLAAATGGLLAGVTLLLVLWQRRRPMDARQDDPVAAQYRIFCRKLARAGVPRDPAMGPQDYGRRIEALRPDLARSALEIINLYIALRYMPASREDTGAQQRALARLVRAFTPRPLPTRRLAGAGAPGSGQDPAG